MEKEKLKIASCTGRFISAITALFCMFLGKKANAESDEVAFCREWTAILTENARVFNGLYNGLLRIVSGNAKKPEKVLREWIQRTHYKFENQPVDILCQEKIRPLIEKEDRDALIKWSSLLMDAAVAAGMTKEEVTILELTETNTEAYVEWDGGDLYPEDEVEVITPAWYQHGKLLEQGLCRKINVGEE